MSTDNSETEQRPVVKAWDLVASAKTEIDNLSPDEVQAARSADPEGAQTVVVDIRDHRELYLKGRIPGSVHAPRGMLEFWVDPASEYHREVFDPSKRYILYCAGGGRSALAAKTMKDMGYSNVGHLEPGFDGWEAAGMDVEDVKAESKWVPRTT
ncbi:MAG: rhodanese-like domain-containing protein [Acidimicrobiia bacterium]|nr:rhodanese-like domain-containing protein [Acidimicrobiia bacterium]